jgi:hypothetical protein
MDEGREEKAAETRTDRRHHGEPREFDEWPEGNWNIEVTTTWRSGKESRKESSKQSVGVIESSWRENEERLQSVAFGARPH